VCFVGECKNNCFIKASFRDTPSNDGAVLTSFYGLINFIEIFEAVENCF